MKKALLVAMPIKALSHMDPYVGKDVRKEDDIWRTFFTIAREYKEMATPMLPTMRLKCEDVVRRISAVPFPKAGRLEVKR